MALARAGARARGAVMVVTLEPCAHRGRTPPCVAALVEAGVRRVVVATRDPHSIVDGRGLRALRAAGVKVEVGLLAAEARAALGGSWLTHTRGRPRVTLKLAASLDGRIAPAGGFARAGRERWLTGAPARRVVHRMRAFADAVVIGAGTARADDPRLTARGVRGAVRQPLRVVCDTTLSLPPRLKLFGGRLARGTVVACATDAPVARERSLAARGVTVWRLPRTADGVSPSALMERLGREGRHEVLVEGGGTLACAFLRAGVVDRIAMFTAPRLLGAGGLAWCGPLPRPVALGRVLEHRLVGADLFAMIETGA
jgi:diaminohydroxyphosphoribosylaminopyrimidine deaminase/5-amino-6-(5-phosphoribosylamino)uracil reductase